MKKIIICGFFLIFPMSVYTYFDIKLCKNDFSNTCPSYSVGKVIKDVKLKKILNQQKMIFPVSNNYVFLFSGGIDNYNDVVLNSVHLYGELSYYPKKNDILIYWTSKYLEKSKIKDNYIVDLNSKDSYIRNVAHKVMGKEEYEYIINGYEKDFLFNDFLGFEKIYCENDIIKINYIKDKPQIISLNIFDNLTYPKVKEGYNLVDLEKDLQVLAPCSNFNKLFGLEEEKEITKIIDKKENISWFDKLIDFILNLFK